MNKLLNSLFTAFKTVIDTRELAFLIFFKVYDLPEMFLGFYFLLLFIMVGVTTYLLYNSPDDQGTEHQG